MKITDTYAVLKDGSTFTMTLGHFSKIDALKNALETAPMYTNSDKIVGFYLNAYPGQTYVRALLEKNRDWEHEAN